MSDESSKRRLGRVRLNDELIEPLFRGDLTVIEGLPDDARYRRMYEDPVHGCTWFVFKSREFEPLDEGDEIPVVDVTVAKVVEQ